MASNGSQQQLANAKHAHRENDLEHFAIISKSIGSIVANSSNDQFKSDICDVLNAKLGCQKKNIEAKAMKFMKDNYNQPSQSTSRDKNSSKQPNNDKE